MTTKVGSASAAVVEGPFPYAQAMKRVLGDIDPLRIFSHDVVGVVAAYAVAPIYDERDYAEDCRCASVPPLMVTLATADEIWKFWNGPDPMDLWRQKANPGLVAERWLPGVYMPISVAHKDGCITKFTLRKFQDISTLFHNFYRNLLRRAGDKPVEQPRIVFVRIENPDKHMTACSKGTRVDAELDLLPISAAIHHTRKLTGKSPLVNEKGKERQCTLGSVLDIGDDKDSSIRLYNVYLYGRDGGRVIAAVKDFPVDTSQKV